VTYPTENTLEGRLIETGGRNGFSSALRGFRVGTQWANLEAILIASDNDENPDASFTEVQEQVRAAGGYGVPVEPLTVTRAESAVPLVVLMVPWAGEPGSLDSLCLPAMYAKWPEGKKLLDEFCDSTSVSHWPSVVKQAKLRVQVLLSTMCRTDPNTTLRYAWSGDGRGELIPLGHNTFDKIADFIRYFGALLQA